MTIPAQRQYLAIAVLTATPAKLRLMLIEAGVRHVRSALDLLQSARSAEAATSLASAQEMIIELIGGMRPERAPALVANVTQLYSYILQLLTAAYLDGDALPARQALELLEHDRATWLRVCEQQPDASATQQATSCEPGCSFDA